MTPLRSHGCLGHQYMKEESSWGAMRIGILSSCTGSLSSHRQMLMLSKEQSNIPL